MSIGTSVLREVSDQHEIHIEFVDQVISFSDARYLSYDVDMITFRTLDGATHVFNMKYVQGFWFKLQEKK